MPIDPLTTVAMKPLAERVLTALWDFTGGFVVNRFRLRKHAVELAEETAKLDALKTDLNNRAAQEARQTQQAEVMHQIPQWTGSVGTLLQKASDFQKSFEHTTFCGVTGFCLGHKAVELLIKARKLYDEGRTLLSGGHLIIERGPDAVQPVPAEISRATTLVGAAEPLQKIKNYILDEGIGIIGIYGMGGVGKTTLLKIINNDFLMGSDMFDVAIWVTVSREATNILDIQKTIANRLGISLHNDPVENRNSLFRELSNKRFVLLLDDVWKRLDLAEDLGIPLPKNSTKVCKILFTTRSWEVCYGMDSDKMVNVSLLDKDNSWELFRSKFLSNDDHHHVLDDDPVIRPLAMQVVEKCGGLPMSLITVGRAMAARARSAGDWRDAIAKLDHRPADLSPDMETEVLLRLRFSFDMLRSKTLRDCLLYFALFPEYRNIEKRRIIDYWICEGFLDSKKFVDRDIEVTRQRGHTLITELQNACLLEVDEQQQHVSLHDTVRDMALWISKEEFVVLAGRNCISSQVPALAIWQKATRISLIDNDQLREPPSSCWNLKCSNLTTFLLHGSLLGENVRRNQGFLTRKNMPALKVLDLSGLELYEFPISITSLISLQSLSLRHNHLGSLPVELGKLAKLRQLDLSYNEKLGSIPLQALSGLSSLQILDMSGSYRHDQQGSELRGLGSLTSICELHLSGGGVCSWELLDVIEESEALSRSVRELELRFDLFPPPSGETISRRIDCLSERINSLGLCADKDNPVRGELKLYSDLLEHLQSLSISFFVDAKISIIRWGVAPLFPRLAFLHIEGCGSYDLTCFGSLPCLGQLRVEKCKKLVEIVKDQTTTSSSLFFPKLWQMRLRELPSLVSISTRTLLLPFLEELIVEGCPELERHPWNGGLPCFPKLRYLRIEGCGWHDLTWIGRIPCLGELDVVNCAKLTEILLSDGNIDEDIHDQTTPSSSLVFFPKLRRMSLWNLPSLWSISSHNLLSPSLELLIVEGCPRLRRLPWNGGLPCLKRLEVEECGELTEILLSDGNNNDQTIPPSSLFFPELGTMRSISTCTLRTSSLEFLYVKRCPELTRLTWNGGLQCLKTLEVEDCEKLTEILLSDGNNNENIDDQTIPPSSLFFPELRSMSLVSLRSLRSISTCTLRTPSLEFLYVKRCPELTRLPWNGGLQCLRVLEVEDCEKLTEILLSDGNNDDIDDQTMSPSSLTFLQKMKLRNLPSLGSISTRTLLLTSLEELYVEGCPQLRRLPFSGDSAPCIRSIEGSQTYYCLLKRSPSKKDSAPSFQS